MQVEVQPEFELGQYKGIEVAKVDYNVTDDAKLNELQEKASRLVDSDKEIENGDTANIDFEGFKDDVAFEGGKAEGHNLVIGSGSFIPGFEDQLIGKKAGEEVDVNVTFPADYHAEELAGAPVVFKVKVNAVKVKELPELNDEFAQDTTEFETLAELKADLKAKAEEEAAAKAKSEERNAVVEAVVANTEVEVPEAMVEAEVAKMAEAYNMTLPQIKEALKSNDLEDIKGQLRIRKTIDFLVENAVIA